VKDQWNIKELLEWTSRYFSGQGMEYPRLEAEILLAHILGLERVQLYANFDRPVAQWERKQFRDAILRRVQGEPAAYITGYKEFMSLKFQVNPAVLIPRPDTETLVEKVLELYHGQAVDICDVGTGSGAIAVSLAHYLPHARVVATDISEKALDLARLNAAANRVNISFYQGKLLEPLQNHPSFDVITANLPYIPLNEYAILDPGVREFEPAEALLAPGDGLDLYRQLLPQALEKIKPGGHLFIEVGCSQGREAREIARDFSQIEIIKDLAGRDRILRARKEQDR
jgi:release factor glutamine methyltransferase